MSHQDYISGLTGGPASNSSAYLWGRDQRILKEMAEARKPGWSPSYTAPQPIPSTDSAYYGDPAPSMPAASRPATKTSLQKAWDDNPASCVRAFAVPLGVSVFIIWPLLAMTGALRGSVWLWGFPYNGHLATVLGYGMPAFILLYGSCALAAWRIDRRTTPKKTADDAGGYRPFARKTQK